MDLLAILKQRIKNGFRFCAWLFIGAFRGIQKVIREAEAECSAATTVRAYVFGCVKIYFAPLTGTIHGVIDYARHYPDDSDSSPGKNKS